VRRLAKEMAQLIAAGDQLRRRLKKMIIWKSTHHHTGPHVNFEK
jgi:hypothetical protein